MTGENHNVKCRISRGGWSGCGHEKSWGKEGTNAANNFGYFPACNAVMMLQFDSGHNALGQKAVAWSGKHKNADFLRRS